MNIFPKTFKQCCVGSLAQIFAGVIALAPTSYGFPTRITFIMTFVVLFWITISYYVKISNNN